MFYLLEYSFREQNNVCCRKHFSFGWFYMNVTSTQHNKTHLNAKIATYTRNKGPKTHSGMNNAIRLSFSPHLGLCINCMRMVPVSCRKWWQALQTGITVALHLRATIRAATRRAWKLTVFSFTGHWHMNQCHCQSRDVWGMFA